MLASVFESVGALVVVSGAVVETGRGALVVEEANDRFVAENLISASDLSNLDSSKCVTRTCTDAQLVAAELLRFSRKHTGFWEKKKYLHLSAGHCVSVCVFWVS